MRSLPGTSFAPGEYNPNAPRPAPVTQPAPRPGGPIATSPVMKDIGVLPQDPMQGIGGATGGGFNAWKNPASAQKIRDFMGNPAAKPNPIRGRAYSNATINPLIQAQGGRTARQLAARRGLGRGRGFNRGFQGRLRGAYDQFLKGQAGGTQQPPSLIPDQDFRGNLGGYVKQRRGGTGPYNPNPAPGTGVVRDPISKTLPVDNYPVTMQPGFTDPISKTQPIDNYPVMQDNPVSRWNY